MKKIVLITVLFSALLFGCKQEDNVNNEDYFIWATSPIAAIDDGKVQLYWMKPIILLDKVPGANEKTMIDPDKFAIYISENDMSNFRELVELDRNKLQQDENNYYAYTADKLQNGKSYFFYFASRKKGFETLYSDTVMAVPNKRKSFEVLLTDAGYVSIAQQKNKIAFVSSYTWNNGNNNEPNSVFISNMDGSEKELVRINGYQPTWSPANDIIAFYFDGTVNVGWFPAQIALYNYENKTITPVTDKNYYNWGPNFSSNGELLLYQSSKNTPGTYETNIWAFNLKTLESFQITDISKTSLKTVGRPRLIDNDRFLFHGVYHGQRENCQLFESSVSTKQIIKVFESIWNDCIPAISPDQKKIAFVSDRSKMNQVWIYYIDNKTYSQVTGYSPYESVNTSDNIEWSDNSTIVFTISDNQGNKTIKQRVE